VKRFGSATSALLGLIALLAVGCVRTDEGVAIRSEDAETSNTAQAPTTRTSDDSGPAPGVVATTRAPIPADSVTCAQPTKPGPGIVALVPDPDAPRITVALPDGWSAAPDPGDAAAKMSGPDGMFATVTIAPTKLDPSTAFTEYADKMMAVSTVSSVSVLPAELCDYSGQKLMGAWSDSPQQSVEFLDRIVHIWTNTNNYLVAIHVQAPAGTDGFDAASAVLTEDFDVRLP
jgi:hypothetical protein